MQQTFHTGEICQMSGHYKFVRHMDESIGCHETTDERDIPLHRGDPFPPVRHCEKGAIWTYSRPL